MALFRNKYRIESTRLKNWDYRKEGFYFITICVKNRSCHFGECVSGHMKMNETGNIVAQFWKEIPDHFPNVSLGEFVVMPNHVHGILILDGRDSIIPDASSVETLQCNVSTDDAKENTKNQFMSNISPKPGSISTIVRSYKSVCTKNINLQFPELNFKWQERFHDRIIRDYAEFIRIENYIINNPINWKDDQFFTV